MPVTALLLARQAGPSHKLREVAVYLLSQLFRHLKLGSHSFRSKVKGLQAGVWGGRSFWLVDSHVLTMATPGT